MKESTKPRDSVLAASLVVACVIAAAVLYCSDPSKGGLYPVCLFHRATGLLCPGCGSLRAMHQLLHGHVIRAFQFNPLLIASVPVLFGLALRAWDWRNRRLSLASVPSGRWVWIILGLGIAFTIWRNIPGSYFATLPQ